MLPGAHVLLKAPSRPAPAAPRQQQHHKMLDFVTPARATFFCLLHLQLGFHKSSCPEAGAARPQYSSQGFLALFHLFPSCFRTASQAGQHRPLREGRESAQAGTLCSLWSPRSVSSPHFLFCPTPSFSISRGWRSCGNELMNRVDGLAA